MTHISPYHATSKLFNPHFYSSSSFGNMVAPSSVSADCGSHCIVIAAIYRNLSTMCINNTTLMEPGVHLSCATGNLTASREIDTE